MKNGIKMTLRLFIGAVFGFVVAYLFMNDGINIDLSGFAYPLGLLLAGISAALMVYTLYLNRAVNKTAALELEGEEEDLAEGRMYRQYSDATLTNNLAMIISLALLSLAVITEQIAWLVVWGVIILLLSLAMSLLMPELMKKMYPERNFPSVSDQKYAEKLLSMSDDGERHVMLGGLYKTYLSMNSLLMGTIFLLLFYSILSGTSQLMGILAIAAVLAVTNSQYYSSIRNK